MENTTPIVELIDYTGAGNPDNYYAAKIACFAKNTRLEMNGDALTNIMSLPPAEVDKILAYMAKTIRSSWEFVHYTFLIRNVSRNFTHQFVRTRTASFAQQTQRVTDMSNAEFLPPPNLSERNKRVWDSFCEFIHSTYDSFIHSGMQAEDARSVLPQSTATNIVAGFNLRTLVDLVGKRDNLRAQGEYQSVAQQMKAQVLDAHPWAHPFLPLSAQRQHWTLYCPP